MKEKKRREKHGSRVEKKREGGDLAGQREFEEVKLGEVYISAS